ncbi:MAG: hypothetical protein JWN82_195 [Candidatus Saccharibacteria bacterium]|nr:hypothetical protein [Candidatus Saccharibacteria bacterium]
MGVVTYAGNERFISGEQLVAAGQADWEDLLIAPLNPEDPVVLAKLVLCDTFQEQGDVFDTIQPMLLPRPEGEIQPVASSLPTEFEGVISEALSKLVNDGEIQPDAALTCYALLGMAADYNVPPAEHDEPSYTTWDEPLFTLSSARVPSDTTKMAS